MSPKLAQKYDSLKNLLGAMGSVAVAFSGGVDSTLLAKVAHDVLHDNMLAVTASIRAIPRTDLDDARSWCADEGVEHIIMPYDELTIDGYAQNPPDRCYLCKRAVFGQLMRVARERGIKMLVDGSNVDDDADYRPGMRALAELGIRSPLKECGITKGDVRALSRELGLPTWNRPSAACLASRFVYGETITADKLARVEAAETFLHGLGFDQLRVRVHGADGALARIEVAQADVERLAAPSMRTQVVGRLRELGFSYVSVDLEGFRSGAMNEVL